jgi:hypothetical protein
MSAMARISITCSGCGQLLAAGSDDPRAEVECLWCGTKTPVRAPQVSTAPPAESRRPEPSAAAEPAAHVNPARPEPPPSGPRWFEQTPYNLEGGAPLRPPLEPPAPPPLSPRRPPPSQPPPDDEDRAAYQVETALERPCLGCGVPVPAGAARCPACGLDRETAARRRKTFEPVERNWETGWPLSRRVGLFLTGQAVALPLGLLGSWVLEEWSAFLSPWLVFSALTAFLLGTYARTELTRTERGKVRLTQTWRVCFLPQAPQAIRRSDYEGVATGKASAADFWAWFALVVFLIAGLVPGILWWYLVIRPDSFFVALTRDHGFPERTLYWGWDEGQARDMAETLRAVAFAPT